MAVHDAIIVRVRLPPPLGAFDANVSPIAYVAPKLKGGGLRPIDTSRWAAYFGIGPYPFLSWSPNDVNIINAPGIEWADTVVSPRETTRSIWHEYSKNRGGFQGLMTAEYVTTLDESTTISCGSLEIHRLHPGEILLTHRLNNELWPEGTTAEDIELEYSFERLPYPADLTRVQVELYPAAMTTNGFGYAQFRSRPDGEGSTTPPDWRATTVRAELATGDTIPPRASPEEWTAKLGVTEYARRIQY